MFILSVNGIRRIVWETSIGIVYLKQEQHMQLTIRSLVFILAVKLGEFLKGKIE